METATNGERDTPAYRWPDVPTGRATNPESPSSRLVDHRREQAKNIARAAGRDYVAKTKGGRVGRDPAWSKYRPEASAPVPASAHIRLIFFCVVMSLPAQPPVCIPAVLNLRRVVNDSPTGADREQAVPRIALGEDRSGARIGPGYAGHNDSAVSEITSLPSRYLFVGRAFATG
jgi:hypothetical protein